MDILSTKKMETVRDVEYTFIGEARIGAIMRPSDKTTLFAWGTRLVLSDGREIDVYHHNLLCVVSKERETEVVERTPDGLPASVINFITAKR